jgi:hypothetical protein
MVSLQALVSFVGANTSKDDKQFRHRGSGQSVKPKAVRYHISLSEEVRSACKKTAGELGEGLEWPSPAKFVSC